MVSPRRRGPYTLWHPRIALPYSPANYPTLAFLKLCRFPLPTQVLQQEEGAANPLVYSLSPATQVCESETQSYLRYWISATPISSVNADRITSPRNPICSDSGNCKKIEGKIFERNDLEHYLIVGDVKLALIWKLEARRIC